MKVSHGKGSCGEAIEVDIKDILAFVASFALAVAVKPFTRMSVIHPASRYRHHIRTCIRVFRVSRGKMDTSTEADAQPPDEHAA